MTYLHNIFIEGTHRNSLHRFQIVVGNFRDNFLKNFCGNGLQLSLYEGN